MVLRSDRPIDFLHRMNSWSVIGLAAFPSVKKELDFEGLVETPGEHQLNVIFVLETCVLIACSLI